MEVSDTFLRGAFGKGEHICETLSLSYDPRITAPERMISDIDTMVNI